MPRGTPDYGLPVDVQTEYPQNDLNELAARLDAIEKVNRSGNVVLTLWPENLTNKDIWLNTGNRGYIIPSTKHQMYNRISSKCVCGTTVQDHIGFIYNSAPFHGEQIGVALYAEEGSFDNTVALEFEKVLNQVYTIAKIALNVYDGKLYVWNETGVWHEISTFTIPMGLGMPILLKFSFDTSTQKYGKLWFGSEAVYDLSEHYFQKGTYVYPDTCLTRVYLSNNSGLSCYIYITDVVVTINELV